MGVIQVSRPVLLWLVSTLVAAAALTIGLLAGSGGSAEAPTTSAPSQVEGPDRPSGAAEEQSVPAGQDVVVPDDLVGRDVREVMMSLDQAGLGIQLDGRAVVGHDGVVEGEVVVVDPVGGVRLPPGSSVTITFALATPPVPVAGPVVPGDGPVLSPGSPAGSGCTPGPGSLPDGQWVGYVVSAEGRALSFDLICYDSTTGAVTNDSDAVRAVLMAAEAQVRCAVALCDPEDLRPEVISVLHVRDGLVRFVHPVGLPGPSGAPSVPSGPPADVRPDEVTAASLTSVFVLRAVEGLPAGSVATDAAQQTVAATPLFGAMDGGPTTVTVGPGCSEPDDPVQVCSVTVDTPTQDAAGTWDVRLDVVEDQLVVVDLRAAPLPG